MKIVEFMYYIISDSGKKIKGNYRVPYSRKNSILFERSNLIYFKKILIISFFNIINIFIDFYQKILLINND